MEKWEAEGIYARIQKARENAPTYVLHDGPPYPTGAIHLGTALNKILKDIVVKSKTMAGFRSPYVPGWDCHGLPIETQVEKEFGSKGIVSPADFRKKCREFANKFVDQHLARFQAAGSFRALGKSVSDDESRTCSARGGRVSNFFGKRDMRIAGLKPVYWCLHDHTALAEAEVEYEDHTSPSAWVKFSCGWRRGC